METETRPAADSTLYVDRLRVEVWADRQKAGLAAARAVAERMRELLSTQGKVAMVFAAAPSQRELLAGLATARNLDWSCVVAFHMDEYVGLSPHAPQGFGHFLRKHLFDLVRPGTAHYIDGLATNPSQECVRYASLLRSNPPDIVCAGIGENGHLAFNDPHVADFCDPEQVKIVELGQRSRQQQVTDHCFARIEDVPTHALTMTMSQLLRSRWIYCVVPGPTKAEAVRSALAGPISTSCPASALRTHPGAILYLDRDAAGTGPLG